MYFRMNYNKYKEILLHKIYSGIVFYSFFLSAKEIKIKKKLINFFDKCGNYTKKK